MCYSLPLTEFDEEKLFELSESIKELGIIQPITVRKIENNNYQLISGERRLRACKEIGLKNIPAYVREANDQDSLEMALVENIHRQDLDAIEIAISYQRLIEEINLTQEELSDKIGKNRTTISNYLRLLKLDPIIQSGIRDGFISMGHGRALINVNSNNDQKNIYKKIISKNLSVRNTELLVKDLKGKRVSLDEPGSGTYVDAKLILESNGLSTGDVKAEALKGKAATDALRNGKVDAIFVVAGFPTGAVVELASSVDIKLVPIDGAGAKALTSKYGFFSQSPIPSGTYEGVDEVILLDQ